MIILDWFLWFIGVGIVAVILMAAVSFLMALVK